MISSMPRCAVGFPVVRSCLARYAFNCASVAACSYGACLAFPAIVVLVRPRVWHIIRGRAPKTIFGCLCIDLFLFCGLMAAAQWEHAERRACSSSCGDSNRTAGEKQKKIHHHQKRFTKILQVLNNTIKKSKDQQSQYSTILGTNNPRIRQS